MMIPSDITTSRKFKKQLLVFFTIISLFIIANMFGTMNIRAASDLKVGDYIEFGSYNNQTLLWQVIHLDEEGKPLLWCDKVICHKAYDGVNSENDKDNHDWKTSNIRQWLNSDEKSINWIKTAPSKDTVLNYAYDTEAGFLYGFTAEERKLIKPVINKSLINEYMKITPDGGREWFVSHEYPEKVSIAIHNYDYAYYETTEDKVFLLSLKELYEYIDNQNLSVLKGSDEYWIRDPSFESATSKKVDCNGLINDNSTFLVESEGVCPALYLNTVTNAYKYGNGSSTSPYRNTSTVTSITDDADDDMTTDTSNEDNTPKVSSFTVGNIKWTKISDLYDIALDSNSTEDYYNNPHTVNVLNNKIISTNGHQEIYQTKKDGSEFKTTLLYDFGDDYSIKNDTSDNQILMGHYYGNKLFYTNKKYILCKEYLYYDPINKFDKYKATYLKRFVIINKDGKQAKVNININIPVKKNYAYSIVDIYYSDKKYNLILASLEPGSKEFRAQNLSPVELVKYTSSNLKKWKKIKTYDWNYFNSIDHDKNKSIQSSLRMKYKSITSSIERKIRSYIPLEYKTSNYYTDGSIGYSIDGDVYTKINMTEIKNDAATYVKLDYKLTIYNAKQTTHLGKDYNVAESIEDSYTIPIIIKVWENGKYTIVSPTSLKSSCEKLYTVFKSRESVKMNTYSYLKKLNNHYRKVKKISSSNLKENKQYIIEQYDKYIANYQNYLKSLSFSNESVEYSPFIMKDGSLVIHGYTSEIKNNLILDMDWKGLSKSAVKFKGYIALGSVIYRRSSQADKWDMDLDFGTFVNDIDVDENYYIMGYDNNKTQYSARNKSDTTEQIQLNNFFKCGNSICADDDGIWMSEVVSGK